MISKASYDLIRRVESFGVAMSEEHIASSEEAERLEYLADSCYLVRQTLCPPGKESPRGLIGYHISPAGKDACEQYADAARKAEEHATQIKRNQRDTKRHDFFVAIISSLASSLLTLLVEHFDKIVEIIIKLLNR